LPREPLEPMSEPAREKVDLVGEIREVIYENEESGYAVVRVDVEGKVLPVTVTGHLFGLTEGARVRLHGAFKDHPRFGKQFNAEWHEEIRPASRHGMVAYLASHFEGIGPSLAERIVEHFGDDTYDVLDTDPSRVQEVDGVGQKKAKRIAAAWNERRAIRETATFLQGFGVTAAQVARLHAQYGDATVALVKSNPFRLADEVRGIGFRTADKIAQAIGMAKDAPERARAAVKYLLVEAAGQGHTLLPESEVKRRGEKLEIGAEALERAILDLVDESLVRRAESSPDPSRIVVRDEGRAWGRGGPALYDPGLFDDECFLAATIAQGARGQVPVADVANRVARAASGAKLALAPEQQAAVVRSLTHQLSVITGGPGVGKTTIVRLLVQILLEEDVKVALCAPTGRAAKRLAEATGRAASTIHRLLKYDPIVDSFTHGEHTPLEVDHVIVDECSMFDVPLAAALFRALPDQARITLVGDADQLPSVGPGDFFRALCAARGIEVTRLTQVFRQRDGSRIVEGAHSINHGEVPEFDTPGSTGELFFIERENADSIAETIRHVVVERIPAAYGLDPRRDVQVLTPMHKGSAGAENLNAVLGKALNPDPGLEIARGGKTFRVGDRVVQIKNDYKKNIYNGDQGFVTAIDREGGTLTVRIDDNDVVYEFEELKTLLPAWATTVHRAQGGEHKAVVIALSTQHYPLLRRNLIYTAITRARQLCVVVGNRRALEIAIGASSTHDRYCWLEERLNAALDAAAPKPADETPA
jgi:exodeoxyribonuclease V alpha subunit